MPLNSLGVKSNCIREIGKGSYLDGNGSKTQRVCRRICGEKRKLGSRE